MFYKIENNNCIMCVAESSEQIGSEISVNEYNEILSAIQTCPNRPGMGYRLHTDLTWEEYELPAEETFTEDSLADKTNEELSNILEGLGLSSNMNKANMIRLILDAVL